MTLPDPLDPLDGRSPAADREAFARYLKPRVSELLAAICLDVVYERGRGDSLWYRDEAGREVEVLDLLGGYGATLFGHNHPELVARAQEALASGRPFLAQASARGLAGRLAERLASMVGRETGREWVVTLANSGTEAVEAAIKHAEIEMAGRIEAVHAGVRRVRREIRRRIQDESRSVFPDAVLVRAARLFDVPRVRDLDELTIRIFNHNMEALRREPTFLAVESAFHGKSTGSLKLTDNATFRNPWRRIGLRGRFISPGDDQAIGRALSEATVRYLELELDPEGGLHLREREWVNVSACFVEPIQGEGGIRELPAGFLQALREAADRGGFPLVIDEIQSGLGRTGSLLAASHSGVVGDYYLLGKSLGGGLTKVGALLVDRARYEPEYGYLHTSTFAEDDHSSAVALGALGLIERDGLPARAARAGALLRERLDALQARFPGQLREVRGRGLMLGFELARAHDAASPLVRVLSRQNLLGFVCSGWLLHEAGIRVAPTLSAHGTIRVEPSAYLDEPAIERFAGALERLLVILQQGDSFRLARYLVGRAGQEPPPAPAAAPPAGGSPAHARPDYAPTAWARKVAFLGHFLEPEDVRDWDPGLAAFSSEDCQRFLTRTQGLLEPFIVTRGEVRSLGGEVVNVTVIGLGYTARDATAALQAGETGWILRQLEKALDLARQLGCAIVGFGGFNSIVSDNCRAIPEDELALTSGNSLAAAAGLEAAELAADRLGIVERRLGVLGAAGNIGQVLAEVAADKAEDVLLVGRPGAERRLERVVAEVYFGAWKRLTRQGATGGVAGRIASTRTLRRLEPGMRIGEAIRTGLIEELGPEGAPVRVATDMSALRSRNLIISATNAARPIVLPEHVGPGPVVVSDVAAPRDVDPRVAERPDVLVLKGGILRAPLGQTLEIGGMRLPPGTLYGCLAETILLGFEGTGENFSHGKLTSGRLRRIRELARLHGFTVEELRAE